MVQKYDKAWSRENIRMRFSQSKKDCKNVCVYKAVLRWRRRELKSFFTGWKLGRAFYFVDTHRSTHYKKKRHKILNFCIVYGTIDIGEIQVCPCVEYINPLFISSFFLSLHLQHFYLLLITCFHISPITFLYL